MNEWESAVSMRNTLRRAIAIRFSKTAAQPRAARSRPRHHHARGHVAGGARAGSPRLAVGAWRHPDHVSERPAEGPEAREPDVQADLGHRPLGLAQQRHRSLQSAPLKVAVRRLAKRLLERADEVRLGGQRDPGQRRDVERLVVGTVHSVASAQHAAAGGVDPDHPCDISSADGYTGSNTAWASAAVPLRRARDPFRRAPLTVRPPEARRRSEHEAVFHADQRFEALERATGALGHAGTLRTYSPVPTGTTIDCRR